jgi:hypothetical protein
MYSEYGIALASPSSCDVIAATKTEERVMSARDALDHQQAKLTSFGNAYINTGSSVDTYTQRIPWLYSLGLQSFSSLYHYPVLSSMTRGVIF